MGHLAQSGAVGGRNVAVASGPQPVHSGPIPIRLVELLVLVVPLSSKRGGGVTDLRGPVTELRGSVPGISGVDQFAQPLLAKFQLAPQPLVGRPARGRVPVPNVGGSLALIGRCVAGVGPLLALVEQRLARIQQGIPGIGDGLVLVGAHRRQPVRARG